MQTVTINTNEIPPADVLSLGNTFLNAVKKFYEDPKHLKQFEDWKAKRDQKNKIKN